MSHCFHCNDEIPSGIEISKVINGVSRDFCCHGCLAVSEWIYQENLEQYYDVRESAPSIGDAPQKDFSGYNLPEIYQKYVHQNQGNMQLDLRVEGIHCAACIWLLEQALKRLPGVSNVEGNVTSYLLSITWDDNQTKLSEILTAITQIGYRPILNIMAENRESFYRIRNHLLKKLLVAALGMMQVMMYSAGLYAGAFYGMDAKTERLLQWVSFVITTPVYFYSGSIFILSAAKSLRRLHINMDVPIALAITLAYIASVYHFFSRDGEIYFDTVVMFIFFLSASRYLEMMTRYKAMLKSSEQRELLPEIVKLENNKVIPIEAMKIDDLVVVATGDIIPADGVLIRGESEVNEAQLTGESTAILKRQGDALYAGSINSKNPITLKVTAIAGNTILSETERLLNSARVQKSPLSKFADKVAAKILIFILLSALGSYLIWAFVFDSSDAFSIALSVLVATCPCALSLAVPTVYAAVANRLSENKMYIKNNQLIDNIPNIKHIIFDKTGTLTAELTQVQVLELKQGYDESEVLSIAAALERHFSHPIAVGFRRYDKQELQVTSAEMIEGQGVSGQINGKNYKIGNPKLMAASQSDADVELDSRYIYLSENNQIIATFSLEEQLNPKAEQAISALSSYQLHIASGDNIERVRLIAKRLGISDYHGVMTAKDKLELLKKCQQDGLTMMVGDGINDAPVLSGADISIALGNASSLSQSQADIVLLGQNLGDIPKLLNTANTAKRIIKQNMLWAIGYNVIAIPFAMGGYLQPWVAALGMSISSLVVLCNALRIFWIGKRQ